MFMVRRIKRVTMTSLTIASLLFVIQVDGKNTTNNTANNKPTADDQLKGSRHDVELTRRVREGITSREGLSTQAQNVQIITINGVMTLRGPVKTMGEKEQIASIAKAIAPEVRDELQVTK